MSAYLDFPSLPDSVNYRDFLGVKLHEGAEQLKRTPAPVKPDPMEEESE